MASFFPTQVLAMKKCYDTSINERRIKPTCDRPIKNLSAEISSGHGTECRKNKNDNSNFGIKIVASFLNFKITFDRKLFWWHSQSKVLHKDWNQVAFVYSRLFPFFWVLGCRSPSSSSSSSSVSSSSSPSASTFVRHFSRSLKTTSSQKSFNGSEQVPICAALREGQLFLIRKCCR